MQPHRMNTKIEILPHVVHIHVWKIKEKQKDKNHPHYPQKNDITLDVDMCLLHVSTSLCISHTAKEMECSKLKWPARSIWI